jgi:hypothetical protein
LAEIQNKPVEKRKRGNPNWVKGGPSPHPGGKPKKLVEIEAMLDAEHRTPDNMREVFTRLKELAMEDMITAHTDEKGVEHVTRRPPNPAFMALYLDRILGPVKELKIDLSDAPDEVVAYLAEKLN